MREEKIGQFRFVGAAGTLGDHRGHGFESMGLGQRDGILRQRHQPHRKFHGVARQAPRQSFSVPALVELAEIFADLVRKTDPLRDPLGDLAVAGQNRNADLHGLGKAPLNRLGQFRRRRVRKGARDGAGNRFNELRLVANVDALKVAAKGDLVAKRRRQQVGVAIASDIAKQGLVINIAALMVVEARGLGQPHPQQAGSQREIS
jgi:hypothetical protein